MPPHFRPNIAEMNGYVPGEQPQGEKFIKLNTNENPYPVLAEGEGGDWPGRAGGAAKISRPAGDRVSHRGGRAATASIPIGSCAATAATTFSRSSRGRSSARATWSASPIPATSLYRTLAEIQGAACDIVNYNADWSLPATSLPSRTIGCGWRFWPTRTARRARWCRRSKVAEAGRRPALPAAGRRGVRRLRRHELPVARGARTKRSWSRGR